MREYLADFVPMTIVGLVVANVAHAVGAWPLVSELAGVVAAISVYYAVRKWRARVKVGR
ncbi:hypothetical protein ACWDBD_17290 [Streptomyces sp. NPDC001118]